MCFRLSFPSRHLPAPNGTRESRAYRVNWTKGCYRQLRAFPLQGDPCSDLKLPPAPASTSAAGSADLVSMERGGHHGGETLASWTWAQGPGPPGRPSSLLHAPHFHFPFQQGGSHFLLHELGCLQTHVCCRPRHAYASAGLCTEGQSPQPMLLFKCPEYTTFPPADPFPQVFMQACSKQRYIPK